MGLWVDEKTKCKIEDDKRVIFNLLAEGYDFYEGNDEGAYQCHIRILNKENKIVNNYYRYFLVEDFNDQHYNSFIKKFCNDIEYREQFNVKNDVEDEHDKNVIDERLVKIVSKLNELGLETSCSCQGTDVPWKDRPGKTDGHSDDAYIVFVNPLPAELRKMIEKDNRLHVYDKTVRSAKRKYNSIFSEIFGEIIDNWNPEKEEILSEIRKILWSVVESNTPHSHVSSVDPWTGDCSGETKEMEVGELIEFKNLSLTDLLSEIYTGCSTATYVSRMGLSWTTYFGEVEDKFNEFIMSKFPICSEEEEDDEYDYELETKLMDMLTGFLNEEESMPYFEEILTQLCIKRARKKGTVIR